MCFLKDFKENPPRLALILRITAIGGIDMISCCYKSCQSHLCPMAVNLSINANLGGFSLKSFKKHM